MKIYTKPIDSPICAECGVQLDPANPLYHPEKPGLMVWIHSEGKCKNRGISIALPAIQTPMDIPTISLPKGSS